MPLLDVADQRMQSVGPSDCPGLELTEISLGQSVPDLDIKISP